jgi:hypothetical protein
MAGIVRLTVALPDPETVTERSTFDVESNATSTISAFAKPRSVAVIVDPTVVTVGSSRNRGLTVNVVEAFIELLVAEISCAPFFATGTAKTRKASPVFVDRIEPSGFPSQKNVTDRYLGKPRTDAVSWSPTYPAFFETVRIGAA